MEVNFTAPINSLSYGKCGLNILNALDKQGVKVNLWPIGQIDCEQSYYSLLQQTINNQADYDDDCPSVRLYHEFDLSQHVGRGLHIGYPIFEVNHFNKRRLHHLKSQDKLIVCSQWAKNVCQDNGILIPIDVVPLGVDRDIFCEKSPTYKSKICTFIHVGKREYRKSDWEMLKCFEKAFTKDSNVKLIMCWGSLLLQQINPEEHQKWTDLFIKSKLANKIQLIEWMPSQVDIASILRLADCGLFLSKAEGFNLGCLENLSVANQSIVFNNSGHTEYCSSTNSMLVDITKEEKVFDGVWFQSNEDGTWAAFGPEQEEQTVQYMRDVYRKHQQGDNLFNKEGTITASKFSWQNTVSKLIEAIL